MLAEASNNLIQICQSLSGALPVAFEQMFGKEMKVWNDATGGRDHWFSTAPNGIIVDVRIEVFPYFRFYYPIVRWKLNQ